jgi:hypothetical protein
MDAEWTIKVALNKIISHTETLDNHTKSRRERIKENCQMFKQLTDSMFEQDKRNEPKDQINELSFSSVSAWEMS